MVKSAPNVRPGHIYNKTEAAKLLGVSRVTLRKYTRLRRIEVHYHPLTGSECYTAEAILNAWQRRMGDRIADANSVSTAIGRLKVNGTPSTSFESRLNALRFKAAK